jgi:N-acetylglucosamine kinase-like BadF-type ATPase
MKLILGIDGGGSKTTALLADQNGKTLGRGTAGSCAFQALPEAEVRLALRQSTANAFAEAGIPVQPVTVLGLGISGVDRPGDHLKVDQFLKEENFAKKNIVVNDGLLLLWCGVLQGWGIGVISGTGSIVYGRSRDGRLGRAGGWGFRFGDEGSGFMIGNEALRAIAHADDGRGPQTLLTSLVLNRWGLGKPSDLIPYVYQGNLPYSKVAQLASLVHTAAIQGDETALSILDEAADELTRAVSALCCQLDFSGAIPTAFGGGVLLNMELIRSSLVLGGSNLGIIMDPLELVSEPAQGAVRMALEQV